MAKSVDDVYKEILKLSKDINQLDGKLKDLIEIKKNIKNLDHKIQDVSKRIQEFEIIMDAAELIEEQLGDTDEDDDFPWSPYSDEYESEEYEDYDGIEEDES
jgi:uncharacterized coiled-coil DUF342 family protein